MVVGMWIVWGPDVIHLVNAPAMKTGTLARYYSREGEKKKKTKKDLPFYTASDGTVTGHLLRGRGQYLW
jgi:hypothetical protein